MAYRCGMAGDLRVLEDGVDRHQSTSRPPPPWVWIVVGLVIGIGFGVVFSTPSTSEPEPEASDVTVTELDPVEGFDDGLGISEAIPDFGDALVAVTRTESQNLRHLLWPIAGEPVIRPIPVGAFGEASFDVSGTWLAVSTRIPDTDGNILSVGKPASLAPRASEVTSFAWHDRTSGNLAYTQVIDGEWVLYVSQMSFEPQPVMSRSESGGEVVAWGDWGFAIQEDPTLSTQGEFITLLTPNGDVKTSSPGRVLDSNGDGWIAIHDGDLKLLSAGGGLRSLDFDSGSIGGVLGAAMSPDRAQIAVVGGSGLKVSAIDGALPTVEIQFTVPLTKVEWSSDSRFVILPFLRGVIVVDTANGLTYEKLGHHVVIETSVIPLSR